MSTELERARRRSRYRLRRRVLAEAWFFGRAAAMLSRPVLLLVAVWLFGAIIQRFFGDYGPTGQTSWSDAFFISYCLLFMEHIVARPTSLLTLVVHYVQPVLGVVLLAEGVVKLGIALLRKDRNNSVWVQTMARFSKDHIVLCGAGSVGFRILEELAALGEDVIVIEKDEHCAFLERARALNALVIVGDARDDVVLGKLNIPEARAVIIATNDDLANLEIAMDVRELRSDVAIVMRLFDQRLASKVRASLGVEISFSTSQLAAPLFASAALDRAVVGTHRVGKELLVVVELTVRAGGKLAGATVGLLSQTHDLTVVARRAQGGEWSPQPKPGTKLDVGDSLQILVNSRRLTEIHALNRAG